jgi:toxin ParE1/3/4
MARVGLTQTAHRDLTKILVEIFKNAGASSLHKYDSQFSRTLARLEQFPNSGALRPKLGRNTRLCVVYPYLVYYRHSVAADSVLVLRILHGRRRITRETLRE